MMVPLGIATLGFFSSPAEMSGVRAAVMKCMFMYVRPIFACSYSIVQRSWATTDSLYFSDKEPDYYVLRNSSPGFQKSFWSFELAASSLIYTPVIAPDHLQKNVFHKPLHTDT